MIKVQVYGRNAKVVHGETITSGSVGLKVKLIFDATWDGYDNRTAVFSAGDPGALDSVALGIDVGAGSIVSIPPQMLAEPNTCLYVSIHGKDGNGNSSPTTWAYLGRVQRGADLDAVANTSLIEDNQGGGTTESNQGSQGTQYATDKDILDLFD